MSSKADGHGSDRAELAALRAVVDALLWERLAQRIGAESGQRPMPEASDAPAEPEWSEVAPGISCKILARDAESGGVSLLVRLAPGTHYPPHRHAGVEELYLLDGELWIEDRKLDPGDYARREAASEDHRVWSETGCTCLLLTSARDELL